MSEPRHLSADLIEDLLHESAGAPEAQAARVHLATCSSCAERLAEQRSVAAVLAAASTLVEPIPDDVSLALDAALDRAGRERAAGVVPIRRAERFVGTPLRWLAGAAAAVVVAGASVAAWQLVSPGHPGTANASKAGASTAGAQHTKATAGVRGGTTSQGPGPIFGGHVYVVHQVNAATLAARSATLAAHPGSAVPPRSSDCATPAHGSPASVVLWHGRPAVLTLDSRSATARILDCATATHTLYSTGY